MGKRSASPFEGLEGELREWAGRLRALERLAKDCPEADRGPLVAMGDYLLESCKRFVAALQGEYRPRRPSDWTPEEFEEYRRIANRALSGRGTTIEPLPTTTKTTHQTNQEEMADYIKSHPPDAGKTRLL